MLCLLETSVLRFALLPYYQLIVYLNEAWFYSHDTVCKLVSGSSSQCAVSGQPSRGKRVVVCHASSNGGFVNGAVLLCGKKIVRIVC